MAGKIVLRSCVALLVVLLGTAAVVEAQSQVRTGKNSTKSWWTDMELREELALSPEQISKIDAIEAEFGTRVNELVAAMGTEYRATLAMLAKPEIDDQEYAEQQRKIGEAYANRYSAAAEYWKALRDVLNLQQWRTLREKAPRVFQLGGWRAATSMKRAIRLGEPQKDDGANP